MKTTSSSNLSTSTQNAITAIVFVVLIMLVNYLNINSWISLPYGEAKHIWTYLISILWRVINHVLTKNVTYENDYFRKNSRTGWSGADCHRVSLFCDADDIHHLVRLIKFSFSRISWKTRDHSFSKPYVWKKLILVSYRKMPLKPLPRVLSFSLSCWLTF